MEAKEHEHRNEDRSENCPLRRTGGDKDIYECAEYNECYAERNTCKSNALEEVSACNRKHGAEFCPVEETLELTAEEAEQNVGAHRGHLASHCFVHINNIFVCFGCVAKCKTAEREEAEEDRDHAL